MSECPRALSFAQGPWFRVTFVETAVLQCMTEFMTDCVNADADAGGTEWARDALMAFALTSHQVSTKVVLCSTR